MINRELLAKHAPLFVIGTFMALQRRACRAANAGRDGHVLRAVVHRGARATLSVAMFFCMPVRLAKATLFLFLTNTTSVSFGSAMQYWFTDEQCNPGGPHFDLFFTGWHTAVIAGSSAQLGICIVQR